MATKRTVKKAETVAAKGAVKETAAKAAEAAVKETTVKTAPAKAEAVKEPAAPKTEKAAVKKTAKTAEKKTAAPKRTTTRKSAAKAAVYLQFMGKEIQTEEIVAGVKKIWTDEMGKKESEMKDLKVYLKPEESKAYYVINDEVSGAVDL